MRLNSKSKRKKRHTIKEDVINSRIAIVSATIEQLSEIGIDEDISGKEAKVYDIDKFGGMYAPCSRIVVSNKNELLKALGINHDYIFPTRWLSFS